MNITHTRHLFTAGSQRLLQILMTAGCSYTWNELNIPDS